MAFHVQNLSDALPEPGRTYLFDTNVWRFVLLAPPSINNYEQSYVDFFQGVFLLATNEKCKAKPKIFVNPLILSEVFHACMNIHREGFNENSPEHLLPKDYRKTYHSQTRSKALLSDIEAYKPSFQIASENIDFVSSFFTTPNFCEYADYLYYVIAKQNNMTLVTMDGDFRFEDVHIISANTNLLKLS